MTLILITIKRPAFPRTFKVNFLFVKLFIIVYHFFFQMHPPLIPPRGEVNAADAFDIGSFDEDDVKGVKVRVIMGKMFEPHFH